MTGEVLTWTEFIRCPGCRKIQVASVEHDLEEPAPRRAHFCLSCSYVVSESEWEEIDEDTAAREIEINAHLQKAVGIFGEPATPPEHFNCRCVLPPVQTDSVKHWDDLPWWARAYYSVTFGVRRTWWRFCDLFYVCTRPFRVWWDHS